MYLRTTALSALITAAAACAPTERDAATKDLVADRSGKNIALIFGASNGLEGVATDLAELERLFKSPQYDLGFEVHVVEEASESTILKESAKWAKEAGESGTLFWYFSGHGAEDGTIYTADGNLLGWREVAKSIKAARTTPLKRLMVLEDSCFSGAIVDGSQSIGKYAATSADAIQGAFAAANKAYDAPLYEQILILSASRKTETSADTGAGQGGGFTASFRAVLEKLKTSAADKATIRDFVTKTQKETEQNFGHTPQYRAEPEALVLDDLLFKGTGSGGVALALAVGDDDGAGHVPAAIGAGADVTKVGICKGDKAACSASKQIDVAFGAGSAKGGRLVFRSAAALALESGATITLLGFKSDGSLAAAVPVQATKR